MKIQEAVRVLKEGSCLAIKSMVSGRTFNNRNKLFDRDGSVSIEEVLGEWELIEPKVQYEEVEIKAKCEVSPNGTVILVVPDSEQIAVYPGNKLVILTGTFKREIKPKVKHREQIGFTGAVNFNTTTKIPHDANFFAEWEE